MGTKGNPDKKDVRYGFTAFEQLPTTTVNRKSAIMEGVESVKAAVLAGQVEAGKPVAIAWYAKPTAASAQANVLRKRDTARGVTGFTYKTGKDTDPEDGRVKTILFVMYGSAEATGNGEGETATTASKRRFR